MNTLLLVLEVLLISTILVSVGAAPEATCKQFVGSLTKKQLSGIKSCSKSMKFKSPKDKGKKMNCILKCVLIKEKFLQPDGQFGNEEEFKAFVDSWIPSNLLEAVMPKFTRCKEISGTFDTSDPYCKSYDPLIKCLLDLIGNLCK